MDVNFWSLYTVLTVSFYQTENNIPQKRKVIDFVYISRQESLRQSKSSSKIERKVSFSGADPIVLESSPPKPKRIKEKSERRKKADSNKNCDDLFDQVNILIMNFVISLTPYTHYGTVREIQLQFVHMH